MQPAIGLVELSSIARGLLVSDVMIKKAPVKLLLSKTISPGKYIILVNGDVASCQESTHTGIEESQDFLVDSLFIPYIHEKLIAGIQGNFSSIALESVGIVETISVAAAIVSADAALKSARVNLIEIKLGQGLGGKGYFILSGDLSEIEAALFCAQKVLDGTEKLLRSEKIARPHEEFKVAL